MEEKSKVELRKPKNAVKREFEEYKKNKRLDMQSLKNFISHCNIIEEIIVSYLNILEKEDKDSFLDELLFYYPILSVKSCSIYKVKKFKSEKKRFFELAKQLISLEDSKIKDLNNFLEKEIQSFDEIKHLIPNFKDIDDPDNKYTRWFNCYNTALDCKTEENEEYLFYTLSNNLISEFLKRKLCFKNRIALIKNIINLFKEIEPKRKEQSFCDYFEFLCFALMNCEDKEDKGISLIINAIEDEIKLKFMNLEEIKLFLKQKNFAFTIKDRTISINAYGSTYIIDDYNKYNISEQLIYSIIGKRENRIKQILGQNIKFNELLNKTNYLDGLFVKVIKKYSHSNLAISSIKKLFKIDENQYKEFFKEISNNIENYVKIIPYSCFYDTERTSKNPILILVDPYKEKYSSVKINLIINDNFHNILKEFANIVYRKFAFEHEIHHLTTILLYFLYISENRCLNSLIKEIGDDGEIHIFPNYGEKELKKNKNLYKKAGNLFEILCYGKVLNTFSLKQLLFIANEENDNLEIEIFKKNFLECTNKNLEDILKEFPDNQLLSGYVKKIRECLEEMKNITKQTEDEKLSGNEIIVRKDDDENELEKNIYSILNSEDLNLIDNISRYDNHLFREKRPKYLKKINIK